MKLKPIVGAALCVASAGALAQVYVGAGAGHGSIRSASFSGTAAGAPFSISTDKKSDTAYKIYGGYDFTPNWGAELGYNDLGNKYSFSGTANGGKFSGNDGKFSNWYLALKGTLPLSDGWSLLGKVGAARSKFSGGGGCAGGFCTSLSSDQHTQWLWGAGGQYAFMKNWTGRLEYEDYGKVTSDSPFSGSKNGGGAIKGSSWMLSVNYSFGD